MTLKISPEFNTRFNAAFFKEFTLENPSADEVFSRVTSIALHCLYTGVLILICQKPDERKFRIIPPALLKDLREEIEFEELCTKTLATTPVLKKIEGCISEAVQNIVKDIRTNPANYWPKPYMFTEIRWEQFTKFEFAIVQGAFNQLRKVYTVDDQRVPNTPFAIIDIIVLEPTTGLNSGKRICTLVKQPLSTSAPNAVDFYNSLLSVAEPYRQLYNRIADVSLNRVSDALVLPPDLAKDVTAVIACPGSFFIEFVNEMTNGEIVLSWSPKINNKGNE